MLSIGATLTAPRTMPPGQVDWTTIFHLDNIRERLGVYGLLDVTVGDAREWLGDRFNEDELHEILSLLKSKWEPPDWRNDLAHYADEWQRRYRSSG